MREYIQNLLASPLPAGAEIHPYYDSQAGGYIDDTFRLEGGWYNQPYPLEEGEAEALIAHGALDRR